MQEEDITLNEEWLNENIDRLLSWEILKRSLTLDQQPIPSQKLCDMIGVPKNYVFNVIQVSKEKCTAQSRIH